MNKKIISSGLKSNSFGKTGMSNLINDIGVLATINENKIEFSEWKFSGTEVDENDIVWFCGDIFDEARSLYEIFELKALNIEDKKSVTTIIKVLSKAIDDEKEIGEIGGGGIFINKENSKVLFIPSEVFEQTTRTKDDSNGKFYSKNQGFYIYKGLTGTDTTIFTRASIAFRALTGKFAYDDENISNRQTDILDKNFIPLSYILNGINKNLSLAIDSGLSIPMKFEPLPGEKRYKNEKADKIRKEILKNSKTFDSKLFEKEFFTENRNFELPENDFEKRTKEFKKKQQKKIKYSRFFRRNKSRIFVSIAVLLFVSWGVNSCVEANGKRVSSQGLDSTQTTHLLYTLTHRANSVDLDQICKGKEMKDFNKIISSFYVTSKERESYNASDKTVQPEEWLFYKTTTNYWIYGITNLKIDGKSVEIETELPLKNQNREPIFEEDSVVLKKGDEKTHLAEYYFIHTDSGRINIEKMTEKVTLKWNGKKWFIIRLDGNENSKATTVKTKVFTEEYQKLLDENNGSVKKAISILREKYDWLPTDFDLENGAKTLFNIYHSTSAEQFLME